MAIAPSEVLTRAASKNLWVVFMMSVPLLCGVGTSQT